MSSGIESTWSRTIKPWREPMHTSAPAGPSHSRERLSGVPAPPSSRLLVADQPIREISLDRVDPKVLVAHVGNANWERQYYYSIERYRLLCARALQVARNMRTQVFLVASAIAGEGKTLTSANLAYAMSSAEGKRTLLIELDLRRPSLRQLLGAEPNRDEGLFLDAENWRTHLWQLRPNLHALIAARPAERPDEALHGDAVKRLIEDARREYDFVLIDSAPMLLAVDTHLLLPWVDHGLLVVRADHTPIACSQEALTALGDKGLGCILNDVKSMKYEEYYRAYYK